MKDINDLIAALEPHIRAIGDQGWQIGFILLEAERKGFLDIQAVASYFEIDHGWLYRCRNNARYCGEWYRRDNHERKLPFGIATVVIRHQRESAEHLLNMWDAQGRPTVPYFREYLDSLKKTESKRNRAAHRMVVRGLSKVLPYLDFSSKGLSDKEMRELLSVMDPIMELRRKMTNNFRVRFGEPWTQGREKQAVAASSASQTPECPGGGGNGEACCDRAGEYNGFGSDGPLAFHCPLSCGCHD